MGDVDAIAYTAGPGWPAPAGRFQRGRGAGVALGVPTLPVHHLEGICSRRCCRPTPPSFPFVALLVSGGHTQLMRVAGVGDYALLGETVDDAAGEAFDKTAKLIGLPYPGGPALAKLALEGAGRFKLPPDAAQQGFRFQFQRPQDGGADRRDGAGFSPDADRADLAAEFQAAAVEVLVAKAMAALRTGLRQLVVAGGGGQPGLACRPRRRGGKAQRARVFYPELELCTDNGAMIAFAGAMRLMAGEHG